VQEEVATLARRALAAALKATVRRCDGVVCEQDGLLLVAANHPCPVLANSTLRLGSMDAREVLKRADKFFGPLGHGWETWIRKGADADLEEAAEAAGQRLAPELIGMVLDHAPKIPDLSSDVEITRVEDLEGVRDFVQVATEGFREEADCLPDLIRSLFSKPHSLIATDTAAFVVCRRGEPASTAMTIVNEKVACIGWVTTRPSMRRSGLGRLATAAATRAGFEMGAKLASLEATTMGFTTYASLGYHELLRYHNRWPGGPFHDRNLIVEQS
jgi:GNAT superfamily N-acetyltransferase